ncbi:hypothetical protein PF008_g4683 [Phytophthora fragariae]|nr:hypothetical protein PF008_g4683 [Phytophthora fragariae]
MQRCSTKVGSLIKTEMGELFGLMWDGWSHASVHYVAIYAVCNVGGKRPERLLSLSPLDGGSQDAEVYIEMFKCVLALLWSSGILENRSAVFSAPSSTHKRSVFVIAGRRHVISHNFASVIPVMHQQLDRHAARSAPRPLRHCNNAAELAKHTELKPIKRNTTRWYSSLQAHPR